MGLTARSASTLSPAMMNRKWGHHRTSATLVDESDFVTRNVRLSDNHLLHLALEASQSLDWTALANPPSATSSSSPSHGWTTVKLKDPSVPAAALASASSRVSATSVFSRTQSSTFVVAAHTVVPCSLQELTRVLDAAASSDVMHVIHGDALVSAECVHRVETCATPARTAVPSSGLAVTAVAFEKKKSKASSAAAYFRKRRKRDEWCYLDFVQHISPRVARKTLLSIHPSRVLIDHAADDGDNNTETPSAAAPPSQDVLAGYLFEELDDGKSTRISFWGEHALQQRGDASSGNAIQRALANRAGKTRILRFAESIDRFILVVRRRRLGAQVMADDVKILASNSSCTCCSRSLLLTRKRTCNLCGYYVCDRCSRMEDRERRVRSDSNRSNRSSSSYSSGQSPKTEVSQVRICEKCIARVDMCSYNSVLLDDLAPPRVRPDVASPHRKRTATTGTLLADVLQTALQTSPKTNRTPVLNIVKDIVSHSSPTASRAPRVMLTEQSTEEQHFAVLQAKFEGVPLLPPDECKLANTERRAYLIKHADDLTGTHPYPIPASEQRRLEIVRASQLTALERVEELEIICSIVSSELACLGVMISISEAETFHVVATNIETLPARAFPRSEGFCSRTIMASDPMLVPHPEADIRFSYILPVKHLGVSFYCGFPLFAEDYTVIGSMCCLGSATGTLSQSQFAVGKKLAETASRVLQRHVKLQQEALAATSAATALEVVPERTVVTSTT